MQCLPLELVCDGERHCYLGDDEEYCGVTCPVDCSCKALSVDCSRRNLTSFPSNIDKKIRQLHLRLNSIKNIQFADLQYPFLIDLDINDNCVNSIDYNSFYNLINLQKLDLRNNDITVLKETMFFGLVSLKELLLMGNDIQTIEQYTFQGLVTLSCLNISYINMVEIQAYAFDGLTNLESLVLTYANVDSIGSNSFAGLSNLELLDLSGNNLGYVKTAAFTPLSKLQYLKSDSFKLCCMATQVPRSQCLPEEDPISSCQDLMSNAVLRVFIWILGILACCANSTVVYLRCKNPWTNVPDFIISNLAISDFQVGSVNKIS